MSKQNWSIILISVLLSLVLAGCAPAAAPERLVATEAVEQVAVQPAPPAATEAPAMEAPQATPFASEAGIAFQPQTGPGSERMIIKNGEVRLLVQDTEVAIDRVTQVVGDVGGYIISARVWYQPHGESNYKYATITMGVPVDDFELALRRLRSIAIRVLDENASGEDVTQEYVDLDSRLRNLEATRDRIRTFLEQAKTVEEALKVNQQLSQVEDEIEQVQGRMKYLSGRAAYSTITVNLEPDLPELTPTPTATVTPTPSPVPWLPGETFGDAGRTFISIWKGVANFLIYFSIVGVPCLIPLILIGAGIWWLSKRRKSKRSVVKEEPPKEEAD